MSLIHIKPAPGVRVLDPSQNPPKRLPSEGAVVEKSNYWARRLANGDVVLVAEKSSPPEANITLAASPKTTVTLARATKADKNNK